MQHRIEEKKAGQILQLKNAVDIFCPNKQIKWWLPKLKQLLLQNAFSNFLLLYFAGWFIAVQGLMSVGLALCLLSLLIATISLCCQKQSCSPSGTIAGLLLTTCKSTLVLGLLDIKP